MNTHFAPAERTGEKDLISEIEFVNKNPVISGLLQTISGLLAILDGNRQIIAINNSFIQMLGIDDPADALGLRTGEALHCIHAHEEQGGCGTSKYCSTCKAAIAIVTSLDKDKPVESVCALTAKRGEQDVDLFLMIKAHPIKIESKVFLLLFLQDITLQQQRAALERTFYHDVNNMIYGLVGASELLLRENAESEYAKIIHRASMRLGNEVNIQRRLLQNEPGAYQPSRHETDPRQILDEIESFYTNHPAAKNKNIHFKTPYPSKSITTDLSLLLRVLCNMVTNALEATDKDGEIKIWVDDNDSFLKFNVWNRKPIAEEIARRVFQRNFSTKEGAGRGIGTYSMKLFGEQILGGQVKFTSSKELGTVFILSLPTR